MRARPAILAFLALGATFVGLAIGQACSIYDPSLLLAGDAGGPDSPVVGPDAGTCGAARWPARPDKDDPSTKDFEFFEAVKLLDFGAADAGANLAPTFGFNLDDICTCPMPESCKPISADAAVVKHCDDEGGVDNTGAALIRQFSSTAGFFDQAYINQRIGEGFFGALFRIRGYNGQLNDTKVELSVFVSNGTEGVQVGVPAAPKLDGKDRWTIDPISLQGGTIVDGGTPVPNTYDLNAYVRDGLLVANLDFPLAVGAGNGDGLVTIDLSGSVIVAKLEAYQGTFRATGVIGGRWPTSKLLRSLAVLHDPLDLKAFLCGNDPTYQALKPKICSFADITKNSIEDGKNAPCDSISIGFTFESTPATYGSVFGKPDTGAPCGVQWTDDCQ